jgi:hypothetical protein
MLATIGGAKAPSPFGRATVGVVNWKVLVALGAVAGGLVYAVFRKKRNEADDDELWAEATDPVARFGNP